jgi:RecB family exonuclease
LSGIERVLEVAASTRVLRERRLAALDAAPAGAVLGRELVTLRGLAERCAAETDTPVRALLDAQTSTELVALCARGKGALGAQLAERPGLAGPLAETLRDLRDAGVPPAALGSSDLAATYAELERAHERLAADGLFDRVGLFRLALRGARGYLARHSLGAVEVHGATELVGSAGDLIAALAEGAPLQFFQPDFASPYAERLAAEWSWAFRPQSTEVVSDPALARDGDIPAGALLVRRARSPRVELEGVAREVLRLIVEERVAPSDIQVVARSLDPYAPWLAQTFGGYGIPFTSSLATSDVSSPPVRAWLDLARVLTRDLERAPLVRLLSAPNLVVQGDLGEGVSVSVERIARETAVVRGESDWRAALASAKDSMSARALSEIVERLVAGARALGRARAFAAAVRVVSEQGAALFGVQGESAVREALAAVARLDRVRAAAGVTLAPSREELGRAFDTALLALQTAPFGEDNGGVRVLDAVQARAVPCRHLFLIGMVHGAWPRALVEDPFLPDAAREELRARLRRPVPVRARGAAEERFLLGLLLSQARERVVLSFHESDSTGRAQSPSPLLRALPFVAPGTDVLAGEVTGWEDTGAGFVRAADALARAARAEDPRVREVAGRLPFAAAGAFDAGRELVRRTDSLDDSSLPFDGEVGPGAVALPERLYPVLLEELGSCPLRAFFSRLLNARELESPGADELAPNEAGSFVHEALQFLYRRLFENGSLAQGGSAIAAFEAARRDIPNALEHAARKQRARVRERHPTVWTTYQRTVSAALLDFLERDLGGLLELGVESLETEQPIDVSLALGETRLELRGKIDRIVRDASGALHVGDYKTGRSFQKPLSPTRIRKGLALQIPVYALAVAEREASRNVIGDALTVPLRPERDRDDERARDRSLSLAQLEPLAQPALLELGRLLERGFFPMVPDDAVSDECRYCRYTVACRSEHPPSRTRVTTSEQMRGYAGLGRSPKQ